MPTPIVAKPRSTLAQALGYLNGTRLERVEFTHAYVAEVYRLATKVGIDPTVVVAQACYETGDPDNPNHPFSSAAWVQDGNPAGIGLTDGGKIGYLSTNDPLVSARAHIVHLAGYLYGPDGGWLKNTIYKKLDPRWGALVASGMMGKLVNVEDFGGGIWASTATSKADYSAGVLGYMAKIEGIPATTPNPKPTVRPYILIDAGHRETGSGGLADSDPVEASMTQYLAAEYLKDFIAAGFPCDWYQKTLDGDNDPTLTVGGDLTTVSNGIAAVLAERHESLSIFFSCHYNGAHSDIHVIVPDDTGLTPAIGTAPADDTAGNNPWDVQLASMIAANLAKATGLTLYPSPRLNVPGVMSERDSGVGEQGWRLALFATTAASRAKTIRLIIEHGGHEDTPVRKDDFTTLCGPAVVKAVSDFMGSIV